MLRFARATFIRRPRVTFRGQAVFRTTRIRTILPLQFHTRNLAAQETRRHQVEVFMTKNDDETKKEQQDPQATTTRRMERRANRVRNAAINVGLVVFGTFLGLPVFCAFLFAVFLGLAVIFDFWRMIYEIIFD